MELNIQILMNELEHGWKRFLRNMTDGSRGFPPSWQGSGVLKPSAVSVCPFLMPLSWYITENMN